MSTRKVKEAKDLESNELIYFKGHAKATYMSDGTTVEETINNIAQSGYVTGADVELMITEAITTTLNTEV